MNTANNLISLLFSISTLFVLFMLYKASGKSKPFLGFIVALLFIQGVLGYSGFYSNFDTIPPRFVLLVLPSLLSILILFITEKGRNFIDNFESSSLTLLHSVRIPVEIGLHFLFLEALIPEMMTYEGFNFDILSGISAPFVFWLYFKKKTLKPKMLLAWNMVCLLLLINIVILAFGALPTPFQAWAFNQPNIGVAKFPVVWLPSIIVPAVLLSHIIQIRRLQKQDK